MSPSGFRSAGVVLDGTTLTVVWRSARANGAWRLESTACDATPAGIARAIVALGQNVPSSTRVSVTLMRPVAQMRTVSFPRMARATLENVLARDWTRYVIGTRATPHTAAARPAASEGWRAAFAPTDTLEALAEISVELGWRDVIVQTSDDALATAVRALGTEQRREADLFVIVCDGDGPADGIYLQDGAPAIGRRFPASATDRDALAFLAIAPEPQLAGRRVAKIPVLVLGARQCAVTLAQTLGQAGHHARVLDIGAPADTSAPVLLAIAGTLGAATLPLIAPSVRAARARDMFGVTRWLIMGVAAALIAAFALEKWGVARALASVQKDRADISVQVRNAMTVRAGLDGLTEAASSLANREAAASRAGDVLVAVATALPAGTALTTVSVTGDSVTLEGESKRTAAVYDALRVEPMLERVRLAGPLRQERQAGDVTVDRFAFDARIRHARGVPK